MPSQVRATQTTAATAVPRLERVRRRIRHGSAACSGPRVRGSRRRARRRAAPRLAHESDATALFCADLDVCEGRGGNDVGVSLVVTGFRYPTSPAAPPPLPSQSLRPAERSRSRSHGESLECQCECPPNAPFLALLPEYDRSQPGPSPVHCWRNAWQTGVSVGRASGVAWPSRQRPSACWCPSTRGSPGRRRRVLMTGSTRRSGGCSTSA